LQTLKIKTVSSQLHHLGSVYFNHLRQFKPNARLYLVSVLLTGAAMGIYNLLFNFFVISLGHNEAFIGKLVSLNHASIIVMALLSAVLMRTVSRKWVLIGGVALTAGSVVTMVFVPGQWVILGMSALFGGAQCLITISIAPFLMESSGDEERTYLFSTAFAMQMAAMFGGNWTGGKLPGWLMSAGLVANVEAGYKVALLVMAGLTLLGVLPMLRMRVQPLQKSEISVAMRWPEMLKQSRKMGKLVTPVLITSLGAGLIMPFMNVFFRHVHHQTDERIGLVFAFGSLAMGVGMVAAPPLAERFGKVQLFTLSRGLSLPFLVLLGMSPWFGLAALAYNVRIMLMNMAGPVYQNFVMDEVEPGLRPVASSMLTVGGSLGWGISSMISGWLQVNYGFGPAFVGAGIGYALGVFSAWWFFLRRPRVGKLQHVPVVGD
jgi:MFS family permease